MAPTEHESTVADGILHHGDGHATARSMNGKGHGHLVDGSTQRVLDHHVQTFLAGDLPGLLADYSGSSVVILPNGAVLRGVEQIRPLFVGLFAEFGKPGASFKLGQKVIEEEIAYITWSAETADNVYQFATDTFVIRAEQILIQTIGFITTAKGE